MLNNKKMIEKPWGSEVIWAETKEYIGKIIFINKDNSVANQFHEKKEKTILVNRGSLTLEVSHGHSAKIHTHFLLAGETFHIFPGVMHKYSAPKVFAELIEISTPSLKDMVRS